MSFFDVLSLIGSFIVIVLVIVLTYYASRWYARRVGGGTGGGKYVKIIDKTVLGQTSSMVIAKIDGKYYLVGVSDKNIQLLTELTDFQEEIPEESMEQSSFQKLVKELMDKGTQFAGKRKDGGRP